MGNDRPLPVTLAIADCRMDLKVISFSGEDSLNEVYRYDIDLIGTDPHLDVADWSGRDAFLCFGPPGQGVHGRVAEVAQRYAGTCLSHYRLSLMPELSLLARRRQRRVHSQLSAPALIARLLEEHGIEACAYCFDNPVGLYPPQAFRVQYDETDLHFLQRLCEEEGIHFRFEHTPTGHRLVFADDPASFPEHLPPMRFDPHGEFGEGAPMLRHLAQVWSMPAARAGVPIQPLKTGSAPAMVETNENQGRATNQPFDEPAAARTAHCEADPQRQRSLRDLERLRSERCHVAGMSDRPDVSSGRIMLVTGHPEALLNDQWLVKGVRHCARQLEALEGFDPHDISAILAAGLVDAPLQAPFAALQGYRNQFDALPWATTFRPPLTRSRPRATGEHEATVMPGDPDEQGRLPIRFDWQPVRRNEPNGLMAHALRGPATGLEQFQPGARVRVAHFDSDPDRPVICGLLPESVPASGMELHVNGLRLDATPPSLALGDGERLHVQTCDTLTLHGEQATLELGARWIAIRGPRTVHASPLMDEAGMGELADLQLTTEPALQGRPIAHCAWYIVRMAQPGLEHLARLNPEHILYEGVTDEHGHLGLTTAQLRQLAALYNRTPQALCLVYPGHCLTLHAWLQQNWTERQRRTFTVSGL